MNKKFLIPMLGAFVFAMTYTIANSSLNEDETPMFLENENIAFAGGYTCRPHTTNCPLPGNIAISYIKSYAPPAE